MSQLPDSGVRVSFGEGAAVREDDPDKPSVEGISPYAILRLGALFTNGGVKYGDFRNWELGMPYTRMLGGILRHYCLYFMRDDTEDHLAAIMWNAQCLCHYEDTKTGDDDRPKWGAR